MAPASSLPAPPPRAGRPPRSEVRERVLAAAAQVFAARGFAAASIEEIAAQAGFSKGAVYSNFADKDDLFIALLEAQVAARIAIAEQAMSLAGTEPVAHELARQLGELLAADPNWIPLLLGFWADCVHDPDRLARLERHRGPLRATLAGLIADWTDAHDITLTLGPDEIALTAIALVNGLSVEVLAHPDSVPGDLLGRVLALVLEPAR